MGAPLLSLGECSWGILREVDVVKEWLSGVIIGLLMCFRPVIFHNWAGLGWAGPIDSLFRRVVLLGGADPRATQPQNPHLVR